MGWALLKSIGRCPLRYPGARRSAAGQPLFISAQACRRSLVQSAWRGAGCTRINRSYWSRSLRYSTPPERPPGSTRCGPIATSPTAPASICPRGSSLRSSGLPPGFVERFSPVAFLVLRSWSVETPTSLAATSMAEPQRSASCFFVRPVMYIPPRRPGFTFVRRRRPRAAECTACAAILPLSELCGICFSGRVSIAAPKTSSSSKSELTNGTG